MNTDNNRGSFPSNSCVGTKRVENALVIQGLAWVHLMTLIELGKELDISKRMVQKHRANGMPVNSVKRAKAWYDRHVDPTQRKAARMGGNNAGGRQKKVNQKGEPETKKKVNQKNESKPDSKLKQKEQGELNLRDGEIDLDSTNATTLFFSSRASKEKSLAIQAKAELDLFLGTLIKKEDVERDVFAVMRQMRDQLMTVSKRISAAVASVSSEKSVRKCEQIINEEISRALQDASKKLLTEPLELIPIESEKIKEPKPIKKKKKSKKIKKQKKVKQTE